MEGVLSPLFCHALAEKGYVRSWISPFYRVSTGGVPKLKKLEREIRHLLDTKLPVVVQLMGTNADLIAEVAERFMTIEGVIGLNFNFACPSKRVMLRGAGGACMQNPVLMQEIVEKTMKACPGVSVSAKTRTGFESELECERILPMLRDLGCDFVAVHHRTVKEGYGKGITREERLERAKKAWGDKPLFASGDIFGVDDVLSLEKSGCCEGVMIARGLIRKPLLIAEVREALADPERKHEGDSQQRAQAYDFLEQILNLCQDHKDRYWSHRYLMELSKNLLGLHDPCFRAFTKYSDVDGPEPLMEKLFEFKKAEFESLNE